MFKRGCHGAVGHEVANPTPELEMSSAWGTDYGKYNSPRSFRREAEKCLNPERKSSIPRCFGFK